MKVAWRDSVLDTQRSRGAEAHFMTFEWSFSYLKVKKEFLVGVEKLYIVDIA